MDIDPVSYFETQMGVQLKRVSGYEYAGPCPWCGGTDRFHVWRDKGNFWCRPGPGHCGRDGFVDQLTGEKMTPEERHRLAIESRLAAVERKQREHEQRLSALEQMHRKMYLADAYHQNVNDTDNGALAYWASEGIIPETVERFKLGYCSRCPTDHQHRPSYTIPVIIAGKLYNIRHRIKNADNGDKYRPEMAGLPSVLFNADELYNDYESLIILEGEKKSIVVSQSGFCNNVAIMGKSGFNAAWRVKFERFKRVYVALDPDALDQAAEIARLFGDRGRVVILPEKIDDMIVRYGADWRDIEHLLAQGKRV